MAEKPKPKSEGKKKVICPECDTEVELTQDDEGDYEGRCGGCKLNVGEIYNRRRYQNAMKKIEEQEKEEKEGSAPPKNKPRSWFGN